MGILSYPSLEALLKAYPSLAAVLDRAANRTIEHYIPDLDDATLFSNVIYDLKLELKKIVEQASIALEQADETTAEQAREAYKNAELCLSIC
jgi:hypothetical protein